MITVNHATNDLDFEVASRTHDVERALSSLAIAMRAAPHLKLHAFDPERLCEQADALALEYHVEPVSDERKQYIFECNVEQYDDIGSKDYVRDLVSDWDEFLWVCEDRDIRDAEGDDE